MTDNNPFAAPGSQATSAAVAGLARLERGIRVAAFGLLLALGGCDDAPSDPERPAGVPEQAFWIGGVDGGVFALLTRAAEDPPNLYRATIYFDHSGDVWYRGRLALTPADGPALDPRDPKIFDAWDGDAMLLSDGRRMEALD